MVIKGGKHMKVLLCTPYISNAWDTGVFVAKALSEQGHSVIMWDPRINRQIPSADYDFALVLKGTEIDATELKRSRVNWFPDYLSDFEGIDNFIDSFDLFFTLNKQRRGVFLPGCCDPDVHKPYSSQRQYDVIFVGAATSLERVKFIKMFMHKFKGRFGIFGNDWINYGINTHPIPTIPSFAQSFSTATIALNIHYDMFGVGTNMMVHEIAGCGSAMLLTDNVDGLEETYPMAPKFNSLEECLELTEYYLNNLRERRKLVKEMQKRAYEKFTYKHQVGEILKIVEEKLL